jgi:hypothetical protein
MWARIKRATYAPGEGGAPPEPLTSETRAELPTTIQDYEQEAEYARQLRSGEVTLPPEHPVGVGEDLETEEKSARSKASVLRSYQEADVEPSPKVKVLTSKEMHSYVHMDENGYTVDVLRALKAGVSEEKLVKAVGKDALKEWKAFGEQVKKDNPEAYKVLTNQGVDAYNKAVAAGAFVSKKEQQRFKTDNTQLSDGSWFSNTDLNKIKEDEPELYKTLMDEGVDAYFTKTNKKFETNNVQLGDGTWVTKQSFNALPEKEKAIALKDGLAGLDQYAEHLTLPENIYKMYQESSLRDRFSILQAYGVVPPNAEYVGADKEGNPEYKVGSGLTQKLTGANLPVVLAELVIPGVYTARHWNEMGAGGKALSISGDIITLLPFVGAAARGAKTSFAVTRTGRLLGAAKGIGLEAYSQIKGPVTILLHPVISAKIAGRSALDTLENVVNYRKIPEAVITTSENTIRIPVRATTSEVDAMKIRDEIMRVAATTKEDIVIEFNGQRFTVSRSALMKEVGGGLAHSTPMGEAFTEGLKVSPKPGMPAREQGLFLSHEPLPRFATSSAYGKTGERPTILITSPDLAKDAISSEKIYRGRQGKVVELERKFPIGYEIPQPKQRLYTRIGPEKIKCEILLDKPLSPRQIGKLKSIAFIEDLKAPFKPALLIEGKVADTSLFTREGIGADDIERIAREVRRAGNSTAATNLRQAYRTLTTSSRARSDIVGIGTIERQTPRRTMRDIITVRAIGRPREDLSRDEIRQNRDLPRTITFRVDPRQLERRGDDLPRAVDRTIIPREPSPRETIPRVESPRMTPPREIPLRVRPPRIEPPKKERGFLPSTSTDRQKRQYIKDSGGALCWRQGEVSGKGGGREDVWHIIVSPFVGKSDHLVVVGKRPIGAKVIRGPGSAYQTAQYLYGMNLSQEVKHDIGLFDAHLQPISEGSGIKLTFEHDPSISGTALPISREGKVFPLEKAKKG